jgi:hypothetical protein
MTPTPTSPDSRTSHDFTATRNVAERQEDSFPAVDDGREEWDHPHLADPSQPTNDSAASHTASTRRAIALLDKE